MVHSKEIKRNWAEKGLMEDLIIELKTAIAKLLTNILLLQKYKKKKKQTNLFYSFVCAKSLQSCPTRCNPLDCSVPGSSVHGDSLDQNSGVYCHTLLQAIFPTQASSLSLMSRALAGVFVTTRATQEVNDKYGVLHPSSKVYNCLKST